MVRFIHSADWQLGMSRHFLSADSQARFAAARLEAVRAIGRLAKAEGCAFMVVCGDVFESNQIDRQVLVRTLDVLETIMLPVYLLPGNHDPLDAGSLYRASVFDRHKPENVHVLATSDPVEAAPGVWLHPAPWTTKRPTGDPLDRAIAMLAPSSGALHILAGHGIVDTLSPDRDDPALIELDRLEELVLSGRVAYVALGDRHAATDVGRTGKIWYSGTPEATDYDEVDSGTVLVVELADMAQASVCVARHSVGSWRFIRRQVPMNGQPDIDALTDDLGNLANKSTTVLKLGFEGTLRLRHKIELDSVLEHFSDLFACIEPWRRRTDLAIMPADDDFSDLGLAGFAATAVDELRRLAATPAEDGRRAQDALALLFRLAAGA